MKKKVLVYSLYEKNFKSFIDHYSNSSELKREFDIKVYKKRMKLSDKIIKLLIMIFRPFDIVISDYPSKLLDSSKKFSISMGHGTAIKKFPSEKEMTDKKSFKLISTMKRCKYYLVTSKRQEKFELRSRKLDLINVSKYLDIGLPKNDLLFDLSREEERKDSPKVILYCPTYREQPIPSLFFSKEFFEKLADVLEKNNAIFIYKFHPVSNIFDENRIRSKYKHLIINANKFNLDEDELLLKSDLIISDYSSIAIKFLILQRPILFYLFDYNQYKKYRGIDFDFYDKGITPGEIALTEKEFMEGIYNYFNGEYTEEYWNEIRQKCLKAHYTFPDGNSSKRLWNLIQREA